MGVCVAAAPEGGEGEQRARNRLRRAVAGKEGVVADKAAIDEALLKQGQDNVAAAENQRAGPIKRVGHRQRVTARRRGEQR